MKNYLINLTFNGQLPEDVIKTLFVALICAVIIKIFVWLCALIKNSIFSHKQFSISGIWIASFDSLYKKKRHIIELVKIYQKQEFIYLYMEHYTSATKNVLKYKGFGINRASKISAIYYALDKTCAQHGVFILRIKLNHPDPQPTLNGEYAEFSNDDNRIFHNDYELKRISLSIYRRLKLTLRIQCFNTYDIFNSYISQLK